MFLECHEWKLFFGHYLHEFEAAEPKLAELAISMVQKARVHPKEIIEEHVTKYLILDYKGYEEARKILNKQWRNKNVCGRNKKLCQQHYW